MTARWFRGAKCFAGGCFLHLSLCSFVGCGKGDSVVSAAFEPSSADLGRTPWNTERSFSARFVNRTDKPLAIRDITTSCSCIVIKENYIGRTVEPLGSLEFTGTIDTGYLPGVSEYRLSVISTDDVAYQFTLKVEVEPTWGLVPNILEYDELGSPVQRLRSSKNGVHVRSAAADQPWIQTQVVDNEIETTIDYDLVPVGVATGTVVVYTDDPYVPGLCAPVRVRNARTSRLQPSVIYLYDFTSRSMELRGDGATRIVGVQALPDGVEASIDGTRVVFTRRRAAQSKETSAYVDLSNGEQLGFMLYY